MIGSRLLPPLHSIIFPGATAFLLPHSAQDTLGPGTLELCGCWCESKGEGPLERHQAPTCFAWRGPQPGSLGSLAASLAVPEVKEVASGDTPAAPLYSRAQLPRLLQMDCERHATGGGDIGALLTCSSAQRRLKNLSILRNSLNLNLKRRPPSTWP